MTLGFDDSDSDMDDYRNIDDRKQSSSLASDKPDDSPLDDNEEEDLMVRKGLIIPSVGDCCITLTNPGTRVTSRNGRGRAFGTSVPSRKGREIRQGLPGLTFLILYYYLMCKCIHMWRLTVSITHLVPLVGRGQSDLQAA